MTYNCGKCGNAYDSRASECPRCAMMLEKYPDLVAYIDDCVEKARDNERLREWEEYMGDDL